jgi:hypothetical protein
MGTANPLQYLINLLFLCKREQMCDCLALLGPVGGTI